MPITTTSTPLPLPPSHAINWLQHPPNLLAANPSGVIHTQTSPTAYTITLSIPVLWFFSFTVTTEAVFENRVDGVFVVTKTGGVRTSSEWTVAGLEARDGDRDGQEGCVVREVFRVLECWWGVGWFVRWTAGREHVVLMERVEAGLRAVGESKKVR
ncbi:uncharacterized protein H6S33_001940 [Morchella sextelata]|uniref:uncharacterized protein n=1 Tax=Morchella sextelata TaxID=1174677 RepID=UPI001D036A48|nr:uncharacterized protein H6S33_001940 [Morchella sextelata]KAH0607888.1 hypothetical protein H6S33_001940 [Morchella sextelata]